MVNRGKLSGDLGDLWNIPWSIRSINRAEIWRIISEPLLKQCFLGIIDKKNYFLIYTAEIWRSLSNYLTPLAIYILNYPS